MSKSRGNVVNPDDIIARYGADSLRLYEMFMSPLDQVKPWNTRGVEGTFRFLSRAWRLIVGVDDEDAGTTARPPVQDVAPTNEQSRVLHQAIAKVTEDLEAMRFNTAISTLMEFTNAAYKWPNVPRRQSRRSRCCSRRSRRTSRKSWGTARPPRIARVSPLA
jgi:leucyl-tRNA synthetase